MIKKFLVLCALALAVGCSNDIKLVEEQLKQLKKLLIVEKFEKSLLSQALIVKEFESLFSKDVLFDLVVDDQLDITIDSRNSLVEKYYIMKKSFQQINTSFFGVRVTEESDFMNAKFQINFSAQNSSGTKLHEYFFDVEMKLVKSEKGEFIIEKIKAVH